MIKKLLFLFILVSFFHFSYAEGDGNEEGNTDNSDAVADSSANTENISYNIPSATNYQFRYQAFKSDFLSLDVTSGIDYDIMKKKRRPKRSGGGRDESLIYFSVGTGILILTPTILSAVDKDVSVGGALAADFILAGILTYAILKER